MVIQCIIRRPKQNGKYKKSKLLGRTTDKVDGMDKVDGLDRFVDTLDRLNRLSKLEN